MITPINIFALLLAYLIGSIRSAVWIGKFSYGLTSASTEAKFEDAEG